MLSQLITLKISSEISIFIYEHEHNLLAKNETYIMDISSLTGHVSLTTSPQDQTRIGWKARVCLRVFSTIMLRSNGSKSCMRVDESGDRKKWHRKKCTRKNGTGKNELAGYYSAFSETLINSQQMLMMKADESQHESR